LVDAKWPTASDGLQPLLAAKRTGASDPLLPVATGESGRSINSNGMDPSSPVPISQLVMRHRPAE
jgi:hypothetical protein